MGRKILTLAMVAVLVVSVSGCGRPGSKKLVPVWVWDNVYDDLSGFLVNNDGSFFVKDGRYNQHKIAYYTPRKELTYITKFDNARVVNGRLVSYTRDDDTSIIYNLATKETNIKVNGKLCQNQIDKESLLFERKVRNDPTNIYKSTGNQLVKTKLNGIMQWSLDFKNTNFYSFEPVSLDIDGDMTLILNRHSISNYSYQWYEPSANISINSKGFVFDDNIHNIENSFLGDNGIDETGEKVNLFDIITLDYKTGKIINKIPVEDIDGSLIKLIDKQHVLVAGGNNTRLIDLKTGKNVWEDQLKTLRAYYDVNNPDKILCINGISYFESTCEVVITLGSSNDKKKSNKAVISDELTLVDKESGNILWRYKSDHGTLFGVKYFDDKILLSFERTNSVGKDKNKEYKTVALSSATGKTLWTNDKLHFNILGGDWLNIIEIDLPNNEIDNNTKKKHTVISLNTNDNQSKELIEPETGKTLWRVSNPSASQIIWMGARGNDLLSVTSDGIAKQSLTDGSIVSICKFNRSELGSTNYQSIEPTKLSDKLLGKKDDPIPPSSKEKDELYPVVRDGFVFVQASKKLVIYDLYTFDELYTSEILFNSCDVVNGYVYLMNEDGIAKLELRDIQE